MRGRADERGTMSDRAPVLVVIPALDEERCLGGVLARLAAVDVECDVVLVDDGSTDQTVRIALAGGATVLRHPFNLGHGAALQTGFQHAARHGYTRVVTMDADGQHDPRSIPALLRALEARGADIVLGSRFLDDPFPYPMSWVRRRAIAFFRWVIRLMTGLRVTDPTTGFQALSPRAYRFHCQEHFPPDYPDADVIVRAARSGLRIEEVAVRMYAPQPGRTMHRGFKKLDYVFKQMVALAMVAISLPQADAVAHERASSASATDNEPAPTPV